MGTRTKILAATIAVLALAIAMPVGAQDAGPQTVALVYDDEAVDRPIAEALARLNTSHGTPTRTLDVTAVVNYGHTLEGQCVITVGQKGDSLAAGIEERFGVPAVSAQGSDRYETARLAADAVAAC